jgi:hypothetical protein
MLFLQFIVLPHNYLLRNCYLQQCPPDYFKLPTRPTYSFMSYGDILSHMLWVWSDHAWTALSAKYGWNLKTTNTNWSKLFRSEQSESNKLFDSIEYYIIGSLFDSFVVFVKIARDAAAAGIILIRFRTASFYPAIVMAQQKGSHKEDTCWMHINCEF